MAAPGAVPIPITSPIQTIPQGLLGLLQIKSTGLNPSILSNVVQPQVDLFALWIQRLSQDLASGTLNFATAAAGNQPFPAPMVVPPNQAWFVERYSLDATLGAADFIRLAPSLLYNGVGSAYCVAPDTSDAITTRARRIRTSAGGFWAPPSSVFCVYVFDVLAGTTVPVVGIVHGVAVPV